MKSIEFLNEYYDAESDDYTVVDIDHHRRPRITLLHLQKLRKTHSIEELEQRQRIVDVAYIYGKPSEEF
jgi:hypothetical protein